MRLMIPFPYRMGKGCGRQACDPLAVGLLNAQLKLFRKVGSLRQAIDQLHSLPADWESKRHLAVRPDRRSAHSRHTPGRPASGAGLPDQASANLQSVTVPPRPSCQTVNGWGTSSPMWTRRRTWLNSPSEADWTVLRHRQRIGRVHLCPGAQGTPPWMWSTFSHPCNSGRADSLDAGLYAVRQAIRARWPDDVPRVPTGAIDRDML